MAEKRPIDKKRDAGMSMMIGGPEDSSAVDRMCVIAGSMHVIKKSAIYQVRLADEIDPRRTNAAIPNVQQKVLTQGSDNEMVARTLLTADQLFKAAYLGSSFECERATTLTFAALKNLVAMHEQRCELEEIEKEAAAKLEARPGSDGSYLLPPVTNLEARCETFLQKADHALVELLNIAKLFYGDSAGRKWFASLAELAEARYGKEDGLAKFSRSALPFLRFVRNARNCVEHPKQNARVVVKGFDLSDEGVVWPPSIEVVHPDSPEPRMVVSAFMKQVTDQIVLVIELMIALLCDRHITLRSPFAIQVVELPPEQRVNKHLRFSYGAFDGDRIIPAA